MKYWYMLQYKPSKTMLSERSQKQTTTYCMIPFVGSFQNKQTHWARKYISVCKGIGGVMEDTDFLEKIQG